MVKFSFREFLLLFKAVFNSNSNRSLPRIILVTISVALWKGISCYRLFELNFNLSFNLIVVFSIFRPHDSYDDFYLAMQLLSSMAIIS